MKKRLDVLVYEKGFCESREKAKAIIMSGIIRKQINVAHSMMKNVILKLEETL